MPLRRGSWNRTLRLRQDREPVYTLRASRHKRTGEDVRMRSWNLGSTEGNVHRSIPTLIDTPKTRGLVSVIQSRTLAANTWVEHSFRIRSMAAWRSFAHRAGLLCNSTHFFANDSASLPTRNGSPSCQPSCDASNGVATIGTPL